MQNRTPRIFRRVTDAAARPTAAFVAVALLALGARAHAAVDLKPSANGHYLVDGSGKPFFWLADLVFSGILLGSQRKDVTDYFDIRKTQGFRVVQVLIPERGDKNEFGDPMMDAQGAPGEAFFSHVDFIVDEAKKRGIYIAFMWRSVETFTIATWVGNRYRDRTNVMWWAFDTDGKDALPLVAEGVVGRRLPLDKADEGWAALLPANFVTPSATWDAPWALLRGHVSTGNFDELKELYTKTPNRPAMRIKDGWEDAIPVHTGPLPDLMWWDVLSGHGLQFSDAVDNPQKPEDKAAVWAFTPGFRDYLMSPGYTQAARLAAFWADRPWYALEPDFDKASLTGSVPAETVVARVAPKETYKGALYAFVSAGGVTVKAGQPGNFVGAKASWLDPIGGMTAAAAAPTGKETRYDLPTGFTRGVLALEGSEAYPGAPAASNTGGMAGSSGGAAGGTTGGTGTGEPDAGSPSSGGRGGVGGIGGGSAGRPATAGNGGDTGSRGGSAGSTGRAGAGGAAGNTAGSGGASKPADDSSGCSCSAPGRHPARGFGWMVWVLAGAGGQWRRRVRKRR